MKTRHRRAAIVAAALGALAVAAWLVLDAFQSNLVFFYTPSQIAESPQVGRTFRIGGLVKEGSVSREGLTVRFAVTDTANQVPVRYDGVLPDLFKEGKGVVAQGQLGPDGIFVAREVLAKHDENYMPPEAAEALKQAEAMRSRMAETLETPAGSEAGPK